MVMNSFDESMILRLWDIANTTVGISLANAIVFWYKMADGPFLKLLKDSEFAYLIAVGTSLLGFLLYGVMVTGAYVGFIHLAAPAVTSNAAKVWMWATVFRAVIVGALGILCLLPLVHIKYPLL
ncbi:hypothetical protein [Desulfosediminicola flagellatus]|uniref:hypothetical protein n=1 Tax=Desulfosediminicola flagellatus TaxID=2569541 RepID=UPI0010AD78FE|nr:hypothetical protein [Desulfosediminicola flagellatus]